MFALVLFSQTAHAETISWTQEAQLSDGRSLKISLKSTSSLEVVFPFIMPHIQQSGFDKHYVEFQDPITSRRVVWEGKRGFRPVLVDYVEGVPYLVISGRPTRETEKQYGCPELPFIYLKYVQNEWLPVDVDIAPRQLQTSNIHVGYNIQNGSHYEWTTVQSRRLLAEQMSEGFSPVDIPRSYDAWRIKYKNNLRNERNFGDCRPPKEPPSDIPLPLPTEVELKVLEEIEYRPLEDAPPFTQVRPRMGKISSANCAMHFRLADAEDVSLGYRFSADPTGNKLLPYTAKSREKLQVGQTRTIRICDGESVWFLAELEEPGKTIITKYSSRGDLIYNVRFKKPNIEGNKLWRSIDYGSFTVERDLLAFDWQIELSSLSGPQKINVRRVIRFSFQEPLELPGVTVRK